MIAVQTKVRNIRAQHQSVNHIFSTPEDDDDKSLNEEIQGTYESIQTKSPKQVTKKVAPSPFKEVTSYPPLPVLEQMPPPLLYAQENGCQSIEGTSDGVGMNLTASTKHSFVHKSANHGVFNPPAQTFASRDKAKGTFGKELPQCKPHTSLVQPSPVEEQASSTVDETSYTYASVDMSRKISSKKVSLPTLPSALKTSKELSNVSSHSQKVRKNQSGSHLATNTPPIS